MKALFAEGRLDRAIESLAPEWALKRRKARVALALSGGYVGARRDRRATQSFTPSEMSPDGALNGDLPFLRARSEDMYRNEPLARGAVNTNVTSVVGEGLRQRAIVDRRMLRLTDARAEEIDREFTDRFWAWASTPECDLRRSLNFDAQQRVAFRAVLLDGDCFAYLRNRPRAGSPFGLKLQLIAGARVCNPNRSSDRPNLSAGVEMDADGAPAAYHVTNRHPDDHFRASEPLSWTRVDAFGQRSGMRNMLHLYDAEHIDQTRGVPYLAAVIEPFKQLGRYSEAELMAAVVNACFAVVEKLDVSTTNRSPLADSSSSASTGDLARVGVDFEPGMVIEGLKPNESIDSFTPARPNAQFDPFVQAVMRQIGVGLGIPYEVLIKHFTASYSAARAALLDAWRFFRMRRSWLAASLCQPVYEAFLTEQIASGVISAPGFFADPLIRRAWCNAEWIGPSPGQIDPLKEADAAEKFKAHGWKTDEQITSELTGGDWSENIAQRGREERRRAEAGLPESPGIGGKPTAAPIAPPPPAAEPNPDKPDSDKEDNA